MSAPSIAPLPPLASPASPEAAPRAPAAHPFAELLRQNRLAAAVAAPVPTPLPPTHDDAAVKAGSAEPEATDAPEAPSPRPAATTPRARPKLATTPGVSETAAREAELADRRNDAAEAGGRAEATSGTTTPADALAHAIAHVHGPRADDEDRATGNDSEAPAGIVRRSGQGAGRIAAANTHDVRNAAERDDARARFETALATRADAVASAAATAEAAGAAATAFEGEATPGLLRAESPTSLAAADGAAALARPAPAAPGASAGRVDVALATPVGSPDFAQALGVQVTVLARDGVQQAELHLNPAETGPISVQIAIEGTQARVEFGADAAATRAAIEAGLPELAGALRDAGFTLHGGGVSSHAGGRDRGGDDPGTGRGRATAATGVGSAAGDGARATRTGFVRAGGVDVYA